MANPVSEASAPAIGSNTPLQLDLVQVQSFLLGYNVARQAMTLADPLDPAAIATVARGTPTGAEFTLAVKLSPGSPELADMRELLFRILAELQAHSQVLGAAAPLTDVNVLS